MSGPPFDPNDPEFRAWFIEVNVALDDIDALEKDKRRKKRNRDLGPAKHRELYDEAWGKLMMLMGRHLLNPPEPEPEEPTH